MICSIAHSNVMASILFYLILLPLITTAPLAQINQTTSTTTPPTTTTTVTTTKQTGSSTQWKGILVRVVLGLVCSSPVVGFLFSLLYACCKYHKTISFTERLMKTYKENYGIPIGSQYKCSDLCWDYTIFRSSILWADFCCCCCCCLSTKSEQDSGDIKPYVEFAVKNIGETVENENILFRKKYKDFHEELPSRSYEKFQSITEDYCATPGKFGHSHYCVRDDCNANGHKFYRKCCGGCLEPIIYYLVLDWEYFLTKIDRRKEQLNNSTLSYKDIPYMMLHNDKEVDDDVYEREYKIMKNSKTNIFLSLLNFPSDVSNEQETEAVKYLLIFVHIFNVRMLVKCERLNLSSEVSEGINSQIVDSQDSPSTSRGTGTDVAIPLLPIQRSEKRSTPVEIDSGEINSQTVDLEERLSTLRDTGNVENLPLLSAHHSKEEYSTFGGIDTQAVDLPLLPTDHPEEDSTPVEVEDEPRTTQYTDSFNDQERPIPSTITASTATADTPKHKETSFDEREPLDEDVEKEIIEIEKKPLEKLPGKFGAIRSLNSNVALIQVWMRSFPYTNSKNQIFDLGVEDVKYIYNAVHGGGNAAYTFFQTFQIRRGDREVRYLREILEKKKEDFREAINVLMVYTDDDKISDIKIGDIAKLADSTTHISTDGANLAVEDWKYIADKSGLMEVVDSCQASRRNRGVDGRGAAMFQIIEQRFPGYLIRDFRKVFEQGEAFKFVKDVRKEIREKAEDNVEDRKG